jgi:hypothetical protein
MVVVRLGEHRSLGQNQQEETNHDVTDLLENAEAACGAWPELAEPTDDDDKDKEPARLGEAERIVVWAMTGMFGAVTIYAVTTGDQALLRMLLTTAMLLILRLVGRRTGRPRHKGRNHGTRGKAGPSSG